MGYWHGARAGLVDVDQRKYGGPAQNPDVRQLVFLFGGGRTANFSGNLSRRLHLDPTRFFLFSLLVSKCHAVLLEFT